MITKEDLLSYSIKRGSKEFKLFGNIGILNSNIYRLPEFSSLLEEVTTQTQFLPDDAIFPERAYCIFHDITSRQLCSCGSGKPLVFINFLKGYRGSCSRSCPTKREISRMFTTGKTWTDERREKVKQTNLKRYGVENVFQSEEVKKKIYTPEINEKRTIAIRNGVQNKYGVDNVFQLDDVKRQIIEKNLRLYGGRNHTQKDIPSDIYSYDVMFDLHHTKRMSCLKIAKMYGVDATTVISSLSRLGIEQLYHLRSSLELGMKAFLDSLQVSYIENTRDVLPSGLELDFYLPEHQIGIEMHGLYWHSAKFRSTSYHQDKAEECEAINVRLFQIFEDEWMYDEEKCKRTIRHAIGLSEKGYMARKTTIKEIPWSEAAPFLNTYHLQNAGTPGNYNLGAYHGDELIAVAIFGRFLNESVKDYETELKRFVTDGRSHPGLATKMLTHAVRAKGYQSVIAFVDRRWFNGKFKFIGGFELVHKTGPSLWYVNGFERKHRTFMKKDPTMPGSKRQQLEALGWDQLFDAGKLKLRWQLEMTDEK